MAESKTKIDWKLELIQVPVSDIDRAKAFYVDQVGFNADHDHQFSDEIRFVQLTPRGSGCSISFTTGATRWSPGAWRACSWSSTMRMPLTMSSPGAAWR